MACFAALRKRMKEEQTARRMRGADWPNGRRNRGAN
jgi:hypothetical protein